MMTTWREALPPSPAEIEAEKRRIEPRICTGQERMFRRRARTTVARAQMLPKRSEYGTGLPSSSNAGVLSQLRNSIVVSVLSSVRSLVGVGGGERPQLCDRGRGVLGAVDRGAGDEDVGPGVDDALDGGGGDTAVDLEADLEVRLEIASRVRRIFGRHTSRNFCPRSRVRRS